MLKELILRNRSYRKFYADQPVSVSELKQLIDLARQTPSSKNRQPLKYILVYKKKESDFVFEQLSWAKHLVDWPGPSVDERPPAYIIMLLDTAINPEASIDAGISAQTILLGAVEKGLGGCIIRTVNRQQTAKHFHLPDHLEIIQVIALGKPKQEIKLVEVEHKKTAYFTDRNGVHCVPKRNLEDVIFQHNSD